MSIRVFYRVGLIAAGVILVASLGGLNAQQSTAEAVSIGNDDIGGVVSSAKGPEAGVWVIAETTDLPTKFVKIVVTDDGGRYVLPQLPKPRPAWPGVGITDVRGLDRPGCGRRIAAETARSGAERGHHRVGLGRSQGISAR